jgi:hypothetical protein
VEIPVLADVVGEVRVSPTQLFFGVIKRGHSVERAVVLRTVSREVSVRVPADCCQYPLVAVTVSTNDPGRKFEVRTRVKPGAPVGEFKGILKLEIDLPDEPCVGIPFYGMVVE